jgi:DNA polymerase epsilon subunit 2
VGLSKEDCRSLLTNPHPQTKLSERLKTELSELSFFILSDVWLDHPETLRGLRKLFDNCIENSYIPHVFVFCGNFSSRGVARGNGRDIARYQGMSTVCFHDISDLTPQSENFNALGELIASYPLLTRSSHFVFVPGPLDIAANNVLPRRPILSSLVSQVKNKIPKVHFMTNPCRLNFFGQEIVIFREDMMARMLRNLVGVKPDVRHDDLKRYVGVVSPLRSPRLFR